MEREELMTRIQDIFRDILDNEEIELTDATTAEDVEEWDSLSHIQLIVAIEKSLKIKFSSKEILSWKNVGELVSCAQSKLG